MVPPLVLLVLLLPFYVEDSSASTLSLTRVIRKVSDEIVDSKESNQTSPVSSAEISGVPAGTRRKYSNNLELIEDTEVSLSTYTTIDPGVTDSTEDSESSTDSTPDSISNFTPDCATDSTTDCATESATEYRTDSTTESRTDSTTESRTDYTPESRTDSTTESRTDSTPESTTESRTDSTPESTTESRTDTTPESRTDTTPESRTDTTPESRTDTTSESRTDTTPESRTDTTPKSRTDTTPESRTDTTPESRTDSTTKCPPPDASKDSLHPGFIVLIILAILLIGIGVVLLIAVRSGRLQWPPQNLFSNGLIDPIRPQPVTVKKFPAHCTEMLNVPSKLSHEYQLLATLSVDIYATESFVAGQLPDNKSKNRYVNILPYDSTRVKLAPEGDDFYSDYVNASYIKGYTNEIEYIATQGPKEDTCSDFWKMVYQEPIKVIIMVTQLEEQGKPKCYKYYPNLRENMELEDIIVRCTTELHFPIYTSRTLILTKGERKRSIIHLHFREWPDFGCPATPDLMLQFCQVMRHNIVLAQPGITLIHCSAGVGRTGTLIAVDILLQHIKENKKIDIFGTVYKLRKHRMNMVQSEAQYVYIYKCIKEALEDPSYLSSENSSTTSLEPIYENIECTRLSTVSNKIIPDTVISENECAL